MWTLILAVAFAEEKGIEPVDVLEPGAMRATRTAAIRHREVREVVKPFQAKLKQTLATKNWYATQATHAPAPFSEIWGLVQADLVPAPMETGEAVAVTRQKRGNFSRTRTVRSNLKLTGTLEAPDTVAFGIQETFEGRGLMVTSRDVLIVYNDDTPTHIYATSSQNWSGTVLDSLWTLETDAQGRIVGAEEVAVEHNPEDGGSRAVRRTWTRK